ncbi:sodium:proton antiporter NhaD [Odoribacter lunatus]|uniref:sodium:proton antiporter NhaD n=1 Tax=Odoribacter lunatus TaxID=2941335 RepID=UPI00203B00F9|nr:sodium:proton antiporter NhaD [Odoribacter lunatus]
MITSMMLLFIIGYVLIALENKTGINKTAIALILSILLWTLYISLPPAQIINTDKTDFQNYITEKTSLKQESLQIQSQDFIINNQIIDHLGDISEILLYLLGAMTIVSLIDVHHGFNNITQKIHTRSKKKLLWLVSLLTFFLSAILDNMTTALIMVTLLSKMLNSAKERWLFGSIIVIAANAGGAWTPIGDITTIMLWIGNNITSGHIMQTLFLPSLISCLIPVFIASFSLKGELSIVTAPSASSNATISKKQQNIILLLGVLCLLAVPVFKSLTQLPPFAGILLALGLMWIYIEIYYNHHSEIPISNQYRIPRVLEKVDLSTILFFFGILMAVAALEAVGILTNLANFLNVKIHNVYFITTIIGFLSSVIDNVPLVAATMGMYPVLTPEVATHLPEALYMSNFIQNGTFWDLVAYCAGTGGSILIIGSAAGVVTMSIEKINFLWYLKHISPLAILGFLAGIGIYYLQSFI